MPQLTVSIIILSWRTSRYPVGRAPCGRGFTVGIMKERNKTALQICPSGHVHSLVVIKPFLHQRGSHDSNRFNRLYCKVTIKSPPLHTVGYKIRKNL